MPENTPERELLAELIKHFAVKNGPHAKTNAYGHLELWWAGGSHDQAPSALSNPMMFLADAHNNFSVACLGQLGNIIERAKELLSNDKG